MFADPLTQTYDVIVVGSGATGGWAAKRLSEAGIRVALLEAGREVTPKEFTEHMPAFKLKYRNVSPEIVKTRPIQKQCYACMEYNYDWFVNDLENPYSTPKDKPFTWQRLRILGGRTLVWGRQSYRMSDLDFKAYSHDGYGQDWPVSYKDIAPFYDIVEDYVGISGAAEGNAAKRGLSRGVNFPPVKSAASHIVASPSVTQTACFCPLGARSAACRAWVNSCGSTYPASNLATSVLLSSTYSPGTLRNRTSFP